MLFGGILGISAQVFLLKPLMDCFKEKGVIIIALLASIVQCAGYIISAFYPKKWLMFAFAVPSTLGEFSFAAIASLKSINVSENVSGKPALATSLLPASHEYVVVSGVSIFE